MATKGYKKWESHYRLFLNQLYNIFKLECEYNDVVWNDYIDIEAFKVFVYNHSSRFLTANVNTPDMGLHNGISQTLYNTLKNSYI